MADQVMLVLDQVAKVKGVKNDKGEVMPLSEEKKKLNYNLLVQARNTFGIAVFYSFFGFLPQKWNEMDGNGP